jgi:hypothetical protein
LLDGWLGAVIGASLYAGSRLFSPLEERALAKKFGRPGRRTPRASGCLVVKRWLCAFVV